MYIKSEEMRVVFERKKKNGITFYVSPLFEKYDVNHLFCTRFGGVSKGVFDSLNVSSARKDVYGNTDTADNVAENYRLALSVLEVLPQNACSAHQVHSNNVYCVNEKNAGRGTGKSEPFENGCDGIILRKNTNNVDAVCVKTADCVPILLADVTTGDICAVHAGWRGTVTDIAAKAAVELSGGKTENVIAAIGPCISDCCYEIGGEVYDAFAKLFNSKNINMNDVNVFAEPYERDGDIKRHLNLARANKLLLENCGVKSEKVDISGICTCCFVDENHKKLFFSHRASGGYSGNFLSAISVK